MLPTTAPAIVPGGTCLFSSSAFRLAFVSEVVAWGAVEAAIESEASKELWVDETDLAVSVGGVEVVLVSGETPMVVMADGVPNVMLINARDCWIRAYRGKISSLCLPRKRHLLARS